MKKTLVVFTGAGISAESGVKTFRDSDGLWENHSVEDVATLTGWVKDPILVQDFYNMRRAQMPMVVPNKGHRILAKLEKYFNVQIITQNVDDLHERGGSTNILHSHKREVQRTKKKSMILVTVKLKWANWQKMVLKCVRTLFGLAKTFQR
jgi:NAD-dependent deacetylase